MWMAYFSFSFSLLRFSMLLPFHHKVDVSVQTQLLSCTYDSPPRSVMWHLVQRHMRAAKRSILQEHFTAVSEHTANCNMCVRREFSAVAKQFVQMDQKLKKATTSCKIKKIKKTLKETQIPGTDTEAPGRENPGSLWWWKSCFSYDSCGLNSISNFQSVFGHDSCYFSWLVTNRVHSKIEIM